MSVNEKMTAIANALRRFNTEGLWQKELSLDEMPVAVEDVYESGRTIGELDGEAHGRQAQYDEFWDVYQNYGNGISPDNAFSTSRWKDTNYNPKYDLKFTSTNLTNTFYDSWITDTKKPIHVEGCILNNTFRYSHIVTIPLLIVDENTTNSGGFSAFTTLKNITITGTIANNFNFSTCLNLTNASVDSIIGALKQLAEGDEARTLTLHTTVKANMTDAQIATIQEKGWTLA